MSERLRILSETAKLLGVKPYKITYALVTGLIPEPQLRVGNRRVFCQEDVQRLANYFGISVANEESCAEHQGT